LAASTSSSISSGSWAGGETIVELAPEDLSAMLEQHLWTTFNVARALAVAI